MLSTFYPLLAHTWGGVVIAVAVGAIGWALLAWGRRSASPHTGLAKLFGWVVCAASALLLVGAVVSVIALMRLGSQHPPPGERVDVGGYRMHILAEGDSRGGPTVIWIPGAHAQGLALHHLHVAIRDGTRSVLFDRPGTGWSDPGPFPRRTATEADELATLLERAGEHGPFVLAGHSYGGLLAANFARRYPERTAAVVLLDASPPDAFIYAPVYGAGALEQLVRDGEREGLAKLSARWSDPEPAMAESDTEIGRILRLQNELLADVKPAMDANRRRPATSFAHASIFREFGAGTVTAEVPDIVVYDGELGDLPVLVVIPDEDPAAIIDPLGLDEKAAARAKNFFRRARVRYLEVSTDTRLIHTPPGTGHNYPYETPGFVVEVVRGLLAELRAGE
ncbi:MAG: alpha/beta hydrolase [Gemmatimonadetes bacterium]|nr:alpha/beta hydrolase [Gemmatimonadota bacterium]MYB98172.1 alpha/beta hydrolase [Gemmatimonadota bacterium]MYI45042.1 alpha/beta hydrolase [Gemmatimonadota bacterium]